MRSDSVSWAVRGAAFTLGVGLVFVAASVAFSARDVLLLVFVAIMLGAGLEPVIAWLRARLGLGRGLGILLVYAAFLATVVAIAAFVVPTAVAQLGRAVTRLPIFLENVRTWTSTLRFEPLRDAVGGLIDAAEDALRPAAPPDPQTVVGASIAVFTGLAAVVTLLALVFFWLTERSRLQRYALAFFPEDRRGGLRDGWNEVETRLGLWVRGQLILMASVGAMTGVAYTILGLPAALLLALFAAIAEVIPILGPFIGAVPALLIATSVSPQTAVLTLVVYAVIQIVEGNILVPAVMRNAIGLSPFLVLVSLLAGAAAGGILGAGVAVPLMAAIEAILERLQARETSVAIDVNSESPSNEDREELQRPPAAPKRSRKRGASAS